MKKIRLVFAAGVSAIIAMTVTCTGASKKGSASIVLDIDKVSAWSTNKLPDNSTASLSFVRQSSEYDLILFESGIVLPVAPFSISVIRDDSASFNAIVDSVEYNAADIDSKCQAIFSLLINGGKLVSGFDWKDKSPLSDASLANNRQLLLYSIERVNNVTVVLRSSPATGKYIFQITIYGKR